MKKRVYIIGKVSGLQLHEVTMKFGAAEKKLQESGFIAINPLSVVNNWKAEWQQAMRLCITALMTADAVYALPDADQSRGANVEMNLCKGLEIPMFVTIDGLLKHFGMYSQAECSHPPNRRYLLSQTDLNVDSEIHICGDCSMILQTKQHFSK